MKDWFWLRCVWRLWVWRRRQCPGRIRPSTSRASGPWMSWHQGHQRRGVHLPAERREADRDICSSWGAPARNIRASRHLAVHHGPQEGPRHLHRQVRPERQDRKGTSTRRHHEGELLGQRSSSTASARPVRSRLPTVVSKQAFQSLSTESGPARTPFFSRRRDRGQPFPTPNEGGFAYRMTIHRCSRMWSGARRELALGGAPAW